MKILPVYILVVYSVLMQLAKLLFFGLIGNEQPILENKVKYVLMMTPITLMGLYFQE